MPGLLDRLAARIGLLHAERVYQRFAASVRDLPGAQQHALGRLLAGCADGDYGRQFGLAGVKTVDDLRKAAPIATYEDLRPWVDRAAAGDTQALFSRRQRILMFATTSGTTDKPKLIPVTPAFVADYRRGWNTFGLKLLRDHPEAILRPLLQCSGRLDESAAPSGAPIGAITGLLARTQKRIVRRFYAAPADVAYLPDPTDRYYALMRYGAERDVAFAITANPATLVRMAQVADSESERLIRDVRDGALSVTLPDSPSRRAALRARLRPNPARAAALERVRRKHGALRPRDYWRLSFLACWTGGSMRFHLERLADWYGSVPVRDIGLLASEGRVSLPLEDGVASGVLDPTAGVFEFLPAASAANAGAETRLAHELELGRDYVVVLSNPSGLIRYRLDDVVRVTGFVGHTPLLEFLHRAGNVSSIVGEKLTESQLVSAVEIVRRRRRLPSFDFVAAPSFANPPFYQVSCSAELSSEVAEEVDRALSAQNAEYQSRRNTLRLSRLRIRHVRPEEWIDLDRRLSARVAVAEQYKRPCLFSQPGADDEAFGLR